MKWRKYKPRMCYTLSGTSPLAKLLMMARDCWNLEPPMPASAINWLTALITWVTKTTMGWEHIIHKKQRCICSLFSYADLQMWADYRLALGKLKVFSHEKIEQSSCFRLGGAGTMVTALEDLIAQTATQVCLTLEERTGELQKEMKMPPHVRKTMGIFTQMLYVYMNFAGPFEQRAWAQQTHVVEWWLIGWSERKVSRCPAPSSSVHFAHHPAAAASA